MTDTILQTIGSIEEKAIQHFMHKFPDFKLGDAAFVKNLFPELKDLARMYARTKFYLYLESIEANRKNPYSGSFFLNEKLLDEIRDDAYKELGKSFFKLFEIKDLGEYES